MIVSEFLSLEGLFTFLKSLEIGIYPGIWKGKRYREFVPDRLICQRADGPSGVVPGAPLFSFSGYIVPKIVFIPLYFH